VDVGRDALDLNRQLFGGVVRALFEESGQQDATRRGRSTAALAEPVEHLFDALGVGGVPDGLRGRCIRW
jgi:hypothetical protein